MFLIERSQTAMTFDTESCKIYFEASLKANNKLQSKFS